MDAVWRGLYICFASGLLFATLGRGVPKTCCMKFSKGVPPLKNIANYHMQMRKVGLCPMDAVVFTTLKNGKVCLDPNAPRVKKAMRYIDSKKQGTTAETTKAQPAYITEPSRNGTTSQ